jgi:hypothetical protein
MEREPGIQAGNMEQRVSWKLTDDSKCCYEHVCALLFLFCVETVVIALDALALHFKKRPDLRVFYNFSHTVVYRPNSSADAAFGDAFLETV